MSMVKIDGTKIKLLREQQGLTQLYLATAVEVTTDTISRWENRRYPSIKRDNGLKLAEALNVQLEDILEDTPEDEQTEVHLPQNQADLANLPDSRPSWFRKKWPLLILFTAIFCIIPALTWYFFYGSASNRIAAVRILPDHCISGRPFPVIIEVTGAPDTATALIIKESIPDNGTVQATSPNVTAGSMKNNQIKWLKKIEGKALYAYVVSVSGKEGDTVTFHGTAAISGDPEYPVTGDNTITIDHYHWADTNKDNVIGDDEILAVYDTYSEIKDIDLNIDLIEEIWLGSEYRWDSATGTFKIID